MELKAEDDRKITLQQIQQLFQNPSTEVDMTDGTPLRTLQKIYTHSLGGKWRKTIWALQGKNKIEHETIMQ